MLNFDDSTFSVKGRLSTGELVDLPTMFQGPSHSGDLLFNIPLYENNHNMFFGTGDYEYADYIFFKLSAINLLELLRGAEVEISIEGTQYSQYDALKREINNLKLYIEE